MVRIVNRLKNIRTHLKI